MKIAPEGVASSSLSGRSFSQLPGPLATRLVRHGQSLQDLACPPESPPKGQGKLPNVILIHPYFGMVAVQNKIPQSVLPLLRQIPIYML